VVGPGPGEEAALLARMSLAEKRVWLNRYLFRHHRMMRWNTAVTAGTAAGGGAAHLGVGVTATAAAAAAATANAGTMAAGGVSGEDFENPFDDEGWGGSAAAAATLEDQMALQELHDRDGGGGEDDFEGFAAAAAAMAAEGEEPLAFLEWDRRRPAWEQLREQFAAGTGIGDNLSGIVEVRFAGESSAGSAVLREWFDVVAEAILAESSGCSGLRAAEERAKRRRQEEQEEQEEEEEEKEEEKEKKKQQRKEEKEENDDDEEEGGKRGDEEKEAAADAGTGERRRQRRQRRRRERREARGGGGEKKPAAAQQHELNLLVSRDGRRSFLPSPSSGATPSGAATHLVDFEILGRFVGLALLQQVVVVGLPLHPAFCALLLSGGARYAWTLEGDVAALDAAFVAHKAAKLLATPLEELGLGGGAMDFTDVLDDRGADEMMAMAGDVDLDVDGRVEDEEEDEEEEDEEEEDEEDGMAKDPEAVDFGEDEHERNARDAAVAAAAWAAALKKAASQRVALKPGGADLEVTDENKAEYVRLACEWRLFGSIEAQTAAFARGLHALVPADLMLKLGKMITPTDFSRMVAGLPEIDVADWRAHTDCIAGYTARSRAVVWFWEVVRDDLSAAEREALLQFGTGSRRPPVGGFARLQGFNGGLHRFTLAKARPPRGGAVRPPRPAPPPPPAAAAAAAEGALADSQAAPAAGAAAEKGSGADAVEARLDRLPTAHACVCTVDLPDYGSRAMMLQCLRATIANGSQGFDEQAVAEPNELSDDG